MVRTSGKRGDLRGLEDQKGTRPVLLLPTQAPEGLLGPPRPSPALRILGIMGGRESGRQSRGEMGGRP